VTGSVLLLLLLAIIVVAAWRGQEIERLRNELTEAQIIKTALEARLLVLANEEAKRNE
jgi:hypothetical protein